MLSQAVVSTVIPNTVITLLGSGLQPSDPAVAPVTYGKFENVVVQGNYAYIAAAAGDSTGIIGLSLVIYDISDVTLPTAISYITTGSVVWNSGPSFLNGTYSIAVRGNYVYVASTGSSQFYIVDVSNPYNPFNVSGLLISNSPGSLYGVVVNGNYAYLATQNKGLTVVDISNPLLPTQVFQEGGTLNKSIGVCSYGKYILTTNYQTTSPWTVRYLKIWDATQPTLPILLSTYTLPAGTKPYTVTTNGTTAFVADDNTHSIQIVDISNVLSPNYLASMVASNSFDVSNNVSIDGEFAYIASGANATYGGSIDFFNISNLSNPVLISTYQQGVAGSEYGPQTLINNILYVADYGVSPGSSSYLRTYSTQRFIGNSISSGFTTQVSAQVSSGSGGSGSYYIQGSLDSVNFNNLVVIELASSSSQSAQAVTCCKSVRGSYVNTGSGSVTSSLNLVSYHE